MNSYKGAGAPGRVQDRSSNTGGPNEDGWASPYLDPDQLDFRDQMAYEFHRPLKMAGDFVFHREQAEVIADS